jgi:DNA-binding NtrC family response regulator
VLCVLIRRVTDRKPLVVVIEDDPASSEALSLILRDWGADVVTAASANAAVAALGARAAETSAIITDYNLGPGPDGVSGVRTLALLAPAARVLVLSGSFHGKATRAAAKAGFELMSKPANAEAIIAWLTRA